MMNIIVILAALIGVFFFIRTIFNYEVRLAGLCSEKESKCPCRKNENMTVSAQYYRSYKYLA